MNIKEYLYRWIVVLLELRDLVAYFQVTSIIYAIILIYPIS